MASELIKGSRKERILLTPDPLDILEAGERGLSTIRWRYIGMELLSILSNGTCAETFFGKVSPEEDRDILFLHLKTVSRQKERGKIFLNVKPQTLLRYHREIDAEIERRGIDRVRIVFEIREEFLDRNELKSLFLIKGDYAFALAIDDFGTASSNVDRVRELKPEFIKLDMKVFKTAGEVIHVAELLREVNPDAYIIAEKVETIQDLERAVLARINLWQGYFEREILKRKANRP